MDEQNYHLNFEKFREWLNDVDPYTVVGKRYDACDCPIYHFLHEKDNRVAAVYDTVVWEIGVNENNPFEYRTISKRVDNQTFSLLQQIDRPAGETTDKETVTAGECLAILDKVEALWTNSN